MIRFSDLSPAQRGLLVAGAAALFIVIAVLVGASELNLQPLRTLQTVQVGQGGTVVYTIYNPLAILGLAAIVLGLVGAVIGLLSWFSPKLAAGAPAVTPAQTERTSRKLESELTKVLGLIRAHITTNDSYAKSLANAQERLSGLTEAEQVRVIVSLLVAENERMRRDSTDLVSKLDEARKQVESLRVSLTEAQEHVLQDPLTGVGNRRAFDAAMDQAIREASESSVPLSLVICDIDHFKRVNDAFGHQVGDEIIKMFSRVIQEGVRDGDTVVRYGGEEFAVILPSADHDAAKSVAERIRKTFEGKRLTIRETNQKVGQLTASFGVAQFRPGDDPGALVQRADKKLYDAKTSGRNRVAVHSLIDD